MAQRFEMRLSDEFAGRIDEARGLVPRATWIKARLEKVLSEGLSIGEAVPDAGPAAPPRAFVPEYTRLARDQAATVEQRARAKAQSAVVFACPKATCMFSSSEPGVCPHHGNLNLKPR